jgi:hypothetical protein
VNTAARQVPKGPPASWWAIPILLVAAAILVGGNAAARPALAVAVIVVQAALGLSWLVLFSASAEAAVLVGFAVIAADVVVLRTRTATAGSIAGVIGLSVIAVLFHQIARRDSRGETAAVAITLSAIVVGVAIALLLPLRELGAGRSVVFAAVVSAAAALIVTHLLGGPDTPRRLAGLVVGAVVALCCGLPSGGLAVGDAMGAGLAAVVAALLVDRVLARARISGGSDRTTRAYARALALVSALLPLALVCPIAYLAGRIITSGGG